METDYATLEPATRPKNVRTESFMVSPIPAAFEAGYSPHVIQDRPFRPVDAPRADVHAHRQKEGS